jgi:hypothetical protein
VVPVVLLAPSVIDGTQAIWAQITATALLLPGAVAVLLTYRLWLRHPRLRLLPAAAAVLCYTMSLAVMILGNVAPSAVVSGGSATAPPSGAPQPIGDPSTPSTSILSTPAPVPCWSGTGIVVDCREAHRMEEISGLAVCDQAAVVRFLGGSPDVDVVRAQPATAPGGGCAVRTPNDVMQSARNVLQSGTAAAWRRCFDRRTSATVDCSQLHSREYVATGSLRRATQAECLVAVARYLNQLPANLADDLIVGVRDVASGTPDPARCTIDARGSHLLDDSVRDLGSRPVPIHTS